jgi:hypothetical protein
MGAHESTDPRNREREEQGAVLDQPLVVDGEATSGEVTAVALPVTRTQWCPLWDRWCTGAPSSACIAGGRAERWRADRL